MVSTEPAARQARPSASRLAFGFACALLAVVAATLVVLPFVGDQAVMWLVGRDLLAGRHLYTEIFDAKQPGMHLWYAAIAAVAGPGQVVPQAASVAAAAAAGVLVHLLVADGLVDGRVRRWSPVITVAAMLLTLDEYTLGQGELLVCLPAVAALLLVVRAGPSTRAPVLYLLAGLLLGSVAVFKLVLIAVPGVAVLAYMVLSRRERLWSGLAAVAAGSLVAPAAVVAWLAASGDLPAALHAWFVYPGQVLSLEGIRSAGILVAAVARFVVLFAGIGLLALWRLPAVLRHRDPLDVALLAWLVTGIAAYAVQVWWSYYLAILIPALTALALRQLDVLARATGGASRLGVAVAGVLTVPIVAYGLIGATQMIADGGGLTAASRERIAERVAGYDTIRGEIAAAGLRSEDRLHVFGDTRYQLLAERPYALPTNGWSAEFVPPQRWLVVAGELRTVRPEMVFVDLRAAAAIELRGRPAADVLASDYAVVRTGSAGTWYRRR
jgi:hypothetical protein